MPHWGLGVVVWCLCPCHGTGGLSQAIAVVVSRVARLLYIWYWGCFLLIDWYLMWLAWHVLMLQLVFSGVSGRNLFNPLGLRFTWVVESGK